MTTLPDLEPAALEAAIEAYDSFGGGPDTYLVKQVIRAYLAARSTVPEAGKAVVKPLEWRDGRAECQFGDYSIDYDHDDDMSDTPWCCWSPVDSLGHFATAETAVAAAQADYEQRILSALASVPAPSGAEPVAQLGGAPDDLHNLMKVVFADMTVERLNEVCKEVLARRNPALTRLEDRLTASEAEATSLRRKLEETERQRDEARAHHEYFAIQWDEQRIRAETAERKLEEHRKALEALADDLTEVKFGDTTYKRVSLSKDSITRTVAEIRRIASLSGATE